MSLFEQAVRLNNDGVTALLEGNNKSAIASMAKSIQMMKQELVSYKADRSNLKSITYKQEIETMDLPEIDSSEQAVFNQAIKIQCDHAQSELDIHVSTAAVIFNLALAHQQQALRGETFYMVKAEKLYAMVLKLIDDSACQWRTAVVVKLASISNLAQIRFTNGDFEQAYEGLNLAPCFMQKANERLFEEPQVQGLLMAVLLLKAPKIAPAA